MLASFPTYESFPCNLPTNFFVPTPSYTNTSVLTTLIWFVHRHQDQHNQVFSMVAASTRWLAVRADLLCSVLISAVAFTSVLLSQHPGKETKLLILSFPLPVAFLVFHLWVSPVHPIAKRLSSTDNISSSRFQTSKVKHKEPNLVGGGRNTRDPGNEFELKEPNEMVPET